MKRCYVLPLGIISILVFQIIGSSLADVSKRDGPEILVQTGHVSEINSVTFSYDGHYLASAGKDALKIWDAHTGRLLHSKKYCAHSAILFHPKGEYLFIACGDGSLRVLDGKVFRTLKHISLHDSGIVAMSIGLSKNLLATAGTDKKIKLLDLGTWQTLYSFSTGRYDPEDVAISPDGQILASSSHNLIKIWDLSTGHVVRSFVGHGEGIFSFTFSPNGDWLASASSDRTVKIWDTSTWHVVHELSQWARDIEFSRDSRLLFCAGFGITAWDTKLGRKLIALDNTQVISPTISVDPSGQRLASGHNNKEVNLWDALTGKHIKGLGSEAEWSDALAFSPDGQYLSSGGKAFVRLWSTVGGNDLVLTGHGEHIATLSFNHKGNRLAVGSSNTIKLWDLISGRTKYEINAHSSSFTYSRAGRLISSAASKVIFDPKDRWFASAGEDGFIRLWDISTGRLLLELALYAENEPFRDIHDIGVNIAGDQLAAAIRDNVIRIFDTSDGSLIRTLSGHSNAAGLKGWVKSIEYSPDRRWLASGGRDGKLIFWDISDGYKKYVVNAHRLSISDIAFAPNGAAIASLDEEDNIKLWDVPSRKLLRTFTAERLTSVLIPATGLLVASGEKGVHIWDSSSGKELALLITTKGNGADWLVYTSAGFFDGTRLGWKEIQFNFQSEPLKLYEPEQFFNQFYQPGLLADVFRDGKPIREILRDQNDPRALLDISQYRDSKLPIVRITNKFSDPVSSRSVTLTITAEDTGSGLRDLRIFRNQTLVHFEHGVLKPKPGSKTYSLDVPVKLVAGENEITAYAFNDDDLKSKDAQIVLQGAESLKRKGTAYVLAIGINQYNNPKYNLNYAEADAKAMSQHLGTSLNKLDQYARVVQISLLDHQATQVNILAALSRLAGDTSPLQAGAPTELSKLKPAQPEDAVVVFYAGHGKAKGDRYYLLPHYLNAISDQDLEVAFEKVDAGSIMLVLDACQSGQALEADEKRRGPMNSRGLAQLAYEKGMYILAAAQSDEAAKEFKRLGHGLLTYTLLEEGLKQGRADAQPNDNQLTAREWLDYAVQRVPQLTTEAIAQFRNYKGRDIDFEEQTVTTQAPRAYYRREAGNQWIVDTR